MYWFRYNTVITSYSIHYTKLYEGQVELEEAIENIDIGGPTMLRSAAKNYQDVIVVVDPSDYNTVIDELKATDNVSVKTKFKLSYKVFEHTSHFV